MFGVKLTAILLTSALSGSAAILSAQTIQVDWERQMVPSSSASSARPYTEVFVAVNPRDARHWVAVAIQPDTLVRTNNGCAVFASLDGGTTWRESRLEIVQCGDPWVAFTSRRTVVVTALGAMGELRLLRSSDGGLTWTAPGLSFGRGNDHPVLASIVDSTGNPSGAYLVSSKGQREAGVTRYDAFITPLDSGGGASEPVLLRPSNLSSNTLKSAVLTDGTLFVPFIDYLSSMPGDSTPIQLERRRAWVYRSSPGGGAFSPPLLITDQCGSARGFGELAADLSGGQYRNRLYFACFRHDGNAAIVARSTDRGERWTLSVAVEVPTPGRAARTLSIAVGADGVVGVSWYDRRDDPLNQCQHLYFAASVDGGVRFSAPVRVSNAASCPTAAGNGNGWAGARWQGGGDYSGLAAMPDGGFLAVWADSRSGVYQPYSALIRVKP